MGIPTGESNRSYGGGLPDQKTPIDLNLQKIGGAIKKVEDSIKSVGQVKHEFNELHVKVADIAQAIFNASSLNISKRSSAEKIILSNAEANFEELKITKKELEKELKSLAREVQDYESEMILDLDKLHKASQKVESLRKDEGSGFFHWLFGDTKLSRELKSYTEAGNAQIKAEKAELKVNELKDVKGQLNTYIQELSVRQLQLGTSLNARMRMARDLGQAIKDTKHQHDDLIAKYEAKKEAFYSSETAYKMTKEDKAKIHDKLDSLIIEINKLEALSDDISKMPIGDRESELEFMKASSESFKNIKDAIISSSNEANDFIRNSKSEEMSFTERVAHAVSNFFSFKIVNSKSEGLSLAEISYLSNLYPGLDPYVAKMKYEESLNPKTNEFEINAKAVNPLRSAYEIFKRKAEETIPETLDDDWDVNEEVYTVPEGYEPLPPEFGGPPSDMPPELPNRDEQK